MRELKDFPWLVLMREPGGEMADVEAKFPVTAKQGIGKSTNNHQSTLIPWGRRGGCAWRLYF